MKIIDIRATPVTVPLEAPLRHANGCHWGRFVRTIVEVETDEGLIGLGEMGGGGESGGRGFQWPQAVSHRTRSGASRRDAVPHRQSDGVALQQPHADARGAGVCLSRHSRTEVGRAGLRHSRRTGCAITFRSRRICFFAIRTPRDGSGEVRTCDQLVDEAKSTRSSSTASRSHKLKGGVFPPEYELECYRALADELPPATASASIRTACGRPSRRSGSASAIEDLNNDYLEDPVFGMHGMRRTREKVRMPLATNTVVVNFEQLAANILQTAVDVILLDTTFWGGIRPCVKAAGDLRSVPARRRGAFVGRARHSARDDAASRRGDSESDVRGGRALSPSHRRRHRRRKDASTATERSRCRPTPGLGVKLDRDRVGEYHEQFLRLGGYPYDQDPLRPGWTPIDSESRSGPIRSTRARRPFRSRSRDASDA